MNRHLRSIACLLLALCIALPVIAAPPPGGNPVALLSKVILDVLRKESGKTWEKAVRGQTLASGDMVRTGEGALAIIKFKDNSLVRLREKSELTLTGTQTGNTMSKSVEVQTGVVGFNVAKQRAGEEFRFTSPTSVASIRGTAGVMNSASEADTLTVTEGLVKLFNRKSSRTVDVGAGFTGISGRNGDLLSRATTERERQAALDAMRDDARRHLDIELRNPQGKTSRLKIEFND
jgi:hypothetical protein